MTFRKSTLYGGMVETIRWDIIKFVNYSMRAAPLYIEHSILSIRHGYV